MILTQFAGPLRKVLLQFAQHVEPRAKLHYVPLAVVKGNSFNPFVFGQRLGQAGGGVLPA